MATECCSMVNAFDNTRDHYTREKAFSLNDNLIKQESNTGTQKPTSYTSGVHAARAFEVLHSLRKDEVLCDIKLQTDDGTIVYGHKVILASATQYFHSMFTNFEEREKDLVILQDLDSTALKLLVDFIYTSQIMVTEDKVEDLLYAANLLQLHDVKEVCCDFLQTQLNPTNCLRFKEIASLCECVELFSSFKSYIQQNFSEVVKSDDFLCLQLEQVVELISCNALKVASEECVFECVINWMNHNSEDKEEILLKLMEHVRLPFTSKEYLLNRVKQEPLIKNSVKCKDYIIEALEFLLLKNEQSEFIPNTIRTIPRQPVGLPKIIAVVGFEGMDQRRLILEWYDLVTNKWQISCVVNLCNLQSEGPFEALLNDQSLFLFSYQQSSIIDFNICDLLSPHPRFNNKTVMLRHDRCEYGLGLLDNCIYAIGGLVNLNESKCGEVFNLSTQKWQMISEMATQRRLFGVGVLNNHLYAIGGRNADEFLKSVERYCPRSDTWTLVSEMSEPRYGVGVGVLDGIMYVVGGINGNGKGFTLTVEAYNPRSNVWTLVSCMLKCRYNPKVVSFDGLLYVVGGLQENSVEIYDPRIDTWSMLLDEMSEINTVIGVNVINKSSIFNI